MAEAHCQFKRCTSTWIYTLHVLLNITTHIWVKKLTKYPVIQRVPVGILSSWIPPPWDPFTNFGGLVDRNILYGQQFFGHLTITPICGPFPICCHKFACDGHETRNEFIHFWWNPTWNTMHILTSALIYLFFLQLLVEFQVPIVPDQIMQRKHLLSHFSSIQWNRYQVQFFFSYSPVQWNVSEKWFAALKAVGNLTNKSLFLPQDLIETPNSISTIHSTGNPVDTASCPPWILNNTYIQCYI